MRQRSVWRLLGQVAYVVGYLIVCAAVSVFFTLLFDSAAWGQQCNNGLRSAEFLSSGGPRRWRHDGQLSQCRPDEVVNYNSTLLDNGTCWLNRSGKPCTFGASGIFSAASASKTSPCKTGTTAPNTCAVAECFYDTDATAGSNLYFCTSADTWTPMSGGGGGGGADPGEPFITKTASTPLTNEFALGSLGSGVLLNTTGTGIPTIWDPSTCGSNLFVTDVTNLGALVCTQPSFANLSGAATDAQVTNALTVDLATAATALAANGANCVAGQAAGGVSAAGAAENCITPLVAADINPFSDLVSVVGITGPCNGSTFVRGDGVCAAPSGAGDLTDVFTCTSGDCSALTAASGDNLDMGAATASSPTTRSATLPATCTEGQHHQDTDSGGTETYVCTTTNVWTKFVGPTDNVATATALAADGPNCTAGNYPLGVDAGGAVQTCTLDDDVPEAGDFGALTGGAGIAQSGGTIATASQEANFLADGGVTSLPCGAAAQGKSQVMDNGTLQFCDGAPTSVLRSLAPGPAVTTDNSCMRADGAAGATQDSNTTCTINDSGDQALAGTSTASRFISTVATGTPPLTCISNTSMPGCTADFAGALLSPYVATFTAGGGLASLSNDCNTIACNETLFLDTTSAGAMSSADLPGGVGTEGAFARGTAGTRMNYVDSNGVTHYVADGQSSGATATIDSGTVCSALTCNYFSTADSNPTNPNYLSFYGNSAATSAVVDCTQNKTKQLMLINDNKTDTDALRTWAFCNAQTRVKLGFVGDLPKLDPVGAPGLTCAAGVVGTFYMDNVLDEPCVCRANSGTPKWCLMSNSATCGSATSCNTTTTTTTTTSTTTTSTTTTTTSSTTTTTAGACTASGTLTNGSTVDVRSAAANTSLTNVPRQRLSNAASINICRIDICMGDADGNNATSGVTSGNMHMEIHNDTAGTPDVTNLGSSASVAGSTLVKDIAISAGGSCGTNDNGQMVTFTWSTAVNVTGNFWAVVFNDGVAGPAPTIYVGKTSSPTAYSTTSFDLVNQGTDTDTDAVFTIFTQ